MILISIFSKKKKPREVNKFEDCVAPLGDKCRDNPVFITSVNQLKIFKPLCGGVFDLIHLQHLRYIKNYFTKNSKIFQKEILVYNKMSIDVPFIVLIKVKGSLK